MRKMDDSSTEQELISVECDGSGLHLLPDKLQVLILGSEWGSSKGGLSAINRELTINLAKCPEVHVSFYVPQCNDEEIESACYHNIDLIKAERRPGMAELQWLLSPPPDLHIDVVVGHGVDLGPQAQFIREARKCKWIQVVHKNPEETGMFRTGLDAVSESEKEHEDEVALCKEADFVLTVGPKLAEAFRAYLRSCNQTIFEFTPGILQDVSKVHQVPEEGNKFRVLLCGPGDTKDFSLQGFDIAAKAVALSDSHLVYVGAEGNENELKKRFLECEISAKSLTMRSTLKNRESLNELLCEVDLAVMPTRSDGFGVIGLEALSAGLPVLVSRNSGFGEALIKVPFGSSFVIDLEDIFDDAQVVQEWAKMIKKVKGKERSQRLEESEALRTFYEKKYSWEKQSKDLVREIIKMIQDAPTGSHCSTQHKMSQQTGGPEDESEHLPGTLQMEFSPKSATFEEAQTGDLESVMLEMARHFIDTVAAKIPAERMPESFYYYLAGVRDVEVKRASHGSLRVTVQCKTPGVLDSLWKDYRSGNLNDEAEKRLLTDDIKKRFHVVSVKLQTTIRLVDYLACKRFLTSFPQSDEDQTTDETQTQFVEEPEPMTQHADVKCATTIDPRNWVIHRNEIQFETKQLLEKGAWGPVFRVPFYGRNVAVKQMFPASQIGVTRDFFERQADIASKCHHPCLLEFIGATADDQPPFFVTELMGNDCSLKTRLYPRGYLKEEPTLTEEDVAVISLDVAQALNYLHQNPLSIIHHNISSGKVLLWRRDEQWRAKVSGYETMNFVRDSLGKDVRYRAPELLTNDPSQPISCKVDVYSFGVLLCEMSIRQEPVPQQRRMQIAQIRNRHFRELVQRCVKEGPEGRPNMEKVIEDLRTLISLHHPKLSLKLGKRV